ncbi:uncharacterized protein K02A2.6-like [Cydia amplana]|uniref:uncharacterized protein K02A2.6-like n=1 Tax=Cydia amplana TaxID=1869771 RepID=UPI002FE66A0B
MDNKPLSIKDLKGKCFRCGSQEHQANTCRSINDTCTKCKRKGHLARVCLRSTQANKQIEHELTEDHDTDSSTETVDDNTPWDMNLIQSRNTDKFMINVSLNNKDTVMEVDTGAALSSMSYKDFQKLNTGCKIYKSKITMRTYTKEVFVPFGVAYVTCKCKDKIFDGKLYIMKEDLDAIFGRTWIRAINLFDMDNINQLNLETHPDIEKLISEFPNVFDGTLGCIPNYKGRFTLNENSTPIFVKPRRIPYALKDKVDDEIDRLCKQGVITKIDNSEWGTPVVPIVKPNGSIRLCADYKVTLNKSIRDEQYPIPIIEDILVEMNGGELFCTLDLSQAYLHMMMDEESAMMQTLSTHKGTFKVNRLMFGVKVAPNLWQKFMDQLLQGITGVKCFFDDIIIQGSSEKELLARLRQVLQKLNENNLKLNKDKCHFMKESIEYLGHIIDKNGLHKNKNKVKAITDTKPPSNVNELRTFLGMANYYNKFIPNLASISTPLNNLLKKNAHFVWTQKCAESFNRIKKEILSDRVLTHFNPEHPLVLATDASPTGLGAVLSHRLPDGSDRPIAFASRSLTSSEKKYSQIDKEATSLFWGLKKFFHYCYGRKFILVTDHKPLTTIFHPHKTLPAMSTMRLFHYAHFLSGFNYTIEYRTSNDNSNADYLSRFPVDTISPNIIDVHTAFQLNQMNTIAVDRVKIAEETLRDPEYSILLQALMAGTTVRRYGYNDNELTIQDGCILKGTRVMIPAGLRKHILDELHSGHLGMVRMKLLARGYVYWKNMDKELEDVVRNCRECRLHQNEPPPVTLHHWEPPTGPWQRLHIDFAGPLKGQSLLIVVDAFTKWVEIFPTKTTTSSWCIRKLHEIFITFGFPLTLVSDNGRQFISTEFEDYLKKKGVVHKTSAPYHPATNGQAERYVQTIKKGLKCMDAEPGNLHDKILAVKERLLRTPSTTTGKSPYELMFKRTIRNMLHVQFKTRGEDVGTRPERSEENHTVRSFTVGQRVQARDYTSGRNKWQFGTVTKTLGRLHYEIKTDYGDIWKRHIDQMLSTVIPIQDAEDRS